MFNLIKNKIRKKPTNEQTNTPPPPIPNKQKNAKNPLR